MVKNGSLSSILVAVRVRPFSEEEKQLLDERRPGQLSFASQANLSTSSSNKRGQLRKIVHALDDHVLAFDPPEETGGASGRGGRSVRSGRSSKAHRDMRFAFDRVFNEETTQEEVFEGTSKELIDEVLTGFNSTVFAYGATGCGKTHTISGTQEQPGIIFLTMKELYDRIRESDGEKRFEASMSYLEVYNESIRDLLVPDGVESASLVLREDVKQGVVVKGLGEHYPKNVEEMMELILKGNKRRTVSSTEANATSSRSHAVLQINIRQRNDSSSLSTQYTVATLSFIDLAGSERASVAKNHASRLSEGANINKSLLALGNCINALCENKPDTQHIPYRGSKLTRLLKFSLGGNCKTVMIVCVSPSNTHFEETLNTLKYANRAKNIKTTIVKNTLNVDMHITQYVKLIQELKEEVSKLKGRLHVEEEKNIGLANTSTDESTRATQAKILQELRARLRNSQNKICTREFECKKKTFLFDFYSHRLALLQSWLDSYNTNPTSYAKSFQSSVNNLYHDIHEKRKTVMRDLNFAKDSLSRTLESQNQTLKSVMDEASSRLNSLAIQILEQDKELVYNEYAEDYRNFISDKLTDSLKFESKSLGLLMANNALMLSGLKDFIRAHSELNLDSTFLNKLNTVGINALSEVSQSIAAVPPIPSRPSTPNHIPEIAPSQNLGYDSKSKKRDSEALVSSLKAPSSDPSAEKLNSAKRITVKRVRIDAVSPKVSKAFRQSLSKNSPNQQIIENRSINDPSKNSSNVMTKQSNVVNPSVASSVRLKSHNKPRSSVGFQTNLQNNTQGNRFPLRRQTAVPNQANANLFKSNPVISSRVPKLLHANKVANKVKTEITAFSKQIAQSSSLQPPKLVNQNVVRLNPQVASRPSSREDVIQRPNSREGVRQTSRPSSREDVRPGFQKVNSNEPAQKLTIGSNLSQDNVFRASQSRLLKPTLSSSANRVSLKSTIGPRLISPRLQNISSTKLPNPSLELPTDLRRQNLNPESTSSS